MKASLEFHVSMGSMESWIRACAAVFTVVCIETDGNWTSGKWGPPLFKSISLLSSVINISSYLQSYITFSVAVFLIPTLENPYHSINLPQAINWVLLKAYHQKFPGGQWLGSGFHCCGLGSILGRWTEIPQATCVA